MGSAKLDARADYGHSRNDTVGIFMPGSSFSTDCAAESERLYG